jgi:hypothetical protein
MRKRGNNDTAPGHAISIAGDTPSFKPWPKQRPQFTTEEYMESGGLQKCRKTTR